MASWLHARTPDELAAMVHYAMLTGFVLRSASVIGVLITLGAFTSTADLASASAPRVEAQPTESAEPLAIVQNYLLARNMGDFSGAASWCASLLELQDDESWFVDPPTMTEWLRQLTEKYLIDTVSQPQAQGDIVTWSERLTRRGIASSDTGPLRMTVDVHALVRDGKIAYLSGPYPPIPLRTPSLPAVATVESSSVGRSSGTTIVSPAGLLVLSALGLAVTALLVARFGPPVCGAIARSDTSRLRRSTQKGKKV